MDENHTDPFGYKLSESTENNTALLFFSGKETVQTFSDSIEAITLLFAKWVNLWIAMFENSAKIYF